MKKFLVKALASLLTLLGGEKPGKNFELLNEVQKRWLDRHENSYKDLNAFRDLHAPNAAVSLCFKGFQPPCLRGSFDETFGGFAGMLQHFESVVTKIMTTECNAMTVEMSNQMTTIQNCTGRWTGVATVEFDDQDKAIMVRGYSDDSESVYACVLQLLSTQATPKSAGMEAETNTEL